MNISPPLNFSDVGSGGGNCELAASLLRGNKSAQKAAIDADLVSRVVPIMHPPSGKDAPDQSIILVHYRYRGC